MHDDEPQKTQNDGLAILIGCAAGLVGGAVFGLLILVVTGSELSELSLLVLLHATIAMAIMGGWSAPSLLKGDP